MRIKKTIVNNLLYWLFIIVTFLCLAVTAARGDTSTTPSIPQKPVEAIITKDDHPALCALTAPSHSKMMSEFTGDKTVTELYQFAGANQFPIVARLGVLMSNEGKTQTTVLFIFIKDNGINFRVYRLLTDENHNIVVFTIPGQTLDKSLIDLLRK